VIHVPIKSQCLQGQVVRLSREATILLYAPALDRHLEAMAELADRVFCFYDMQGAGLSQSRRISEEIPQTIWGGLLMRWPWWRRQRPSAPKPVVNPRLLALETAKEILAEVFGARPSDVEEMILAWLEERSRSGKGCSL